MRARRVPTLCCLFVLMLGAVAPAAVAAPTITEFPLSQANTDPLAITTFTDGALLLAEGAQDGLGISTTSGLMITLPTLSSPAAGVAMSNGYAWLTEPNANLIARVNGLGITTQFALPGGSKPEGITAGPDGNVWFTEAGGNGAIGKITPAGAITQYTTGLTSNSQPTAITTGPDGNLWFTELGNGGRIGRITPSGVISEFVVGLTPNSQEGGITGGPDGNVWFTETANPGRIGRITPAGAITEFSTGLTANRQPTDITAGPGGDLWFTEAGNPGAIGWITPQGVISQLATPTANSQPDGITDAPNGAIWFTEDGNHGQLGELTVTAPTAATSAASSVSATSATLGGMVNPNGLATTYHFAWGTTTAYGQNLPAVDASAGAGTVQTPVSQTLTGLTPGTTYHFTLVASNCGGCQSGTVTGPDMSFTTPRAAPPAATTTPPGPGSSTAPAGMAPPVIGQTADARVLAGRVLIQTRGSRTLRRLAAGRRVPLGSMIDATHGRVDVTTEITRRGRMQTATVWGGRFVIGQTGSGGMTTFRPDTGPLDCPVSGHGAVRPQVVSRRGKTNTSLWATDSHGRYSTRGHNSVATVRGTVWKTVESCRGTLTFVRRGVVSVRDLHTGRTVLVHAGHSFLARP